MIFYGTDRDAFAQAAKGRTKRARSRIYQKVKEENAKKREYQDSSSLLSNFTSVQKIPRRSFGANLVLVNTATQIKQSQNYSEKKNILDDIIDYRSSKIVSNISNSLATFIVRCGGQQWSNDTQNIVRSSIALAISEVTNKSFEKPLEIINNIKLFFKIGKTVYKVITWIDKLTKLWTTNDKSISVVSENDIEYLNYLREYTYLAQSKKRPYICGNAMKYKVGDIVMLNNGKTVRINRVNIVSQIYYVTDIEVNGLQYLIRESEIRKLIKRNIG